MSKKILILGSSSWLGAVLLEQLHFANCSYILAGTVYNTKLNFHFNVDLFSAKKLHDYQDVLTKFEPDIIINFLRGEDDEGFAIHKEMILYSKNYFSHYIYASSALALDGYKNIELTESTLANGISEYGLFKAKCERTLYETDIDWTILRFSSLQGWVSHKKTRNENLLQNLANGKKIYVDEGILQNRMLASLMIDGLIKIIQNNVLGIIHFGTLDSSDEISFLKSQAEIFGYHKNNIQSNANTRNVNLVCIPSKIPKMFGDKFKVYEKDTLEELNRIKQLDKYRKL